MALSSQERTLILESLREKCGFRFEEENLSPTLRREVTSLAQKLSEINPFIQQYIRLKDNEGVELGNFHKAEYLGGFVLFIGLISLAASVAAGAVIFLFGLLVLGGAFYMLKPRYLETSAAKAKQKATVDSMEAEVNGQIDSLSKSIMQDLSELHEQKLHPKQVNLNVDLDFKWLQGEMEKGGLVLKTVKCPQCGGKLELPQSGGLVKCQYCGNLIHATDIYDKLKGLLN